MGEVFFGGWIEGVEGNSLAAAAAFELGALTGVVDEDSAHRFGGGEEELRAAGPGDVGVSQEAEVGFVNQLGGLERMVGALAVHTLAGEFFELVVDERQKVAGRFRLSALRISQDGSADDAVVTHSAPHSVILRPSPKLT